MAFGGRNPENRDYNGVSVDIEIDGERVKEGIIGRGWNVEFVVANLHIITEVTSEIDQRNSPGAGAWWRGG